MSITNLDFHFLKRDEGFRLEVFHRHSSHRLTSTRVEFPQSLLSRFELRQLDVDVKEPQLRLNRLRSYGRRLYDSVFAGEIEQIWLNQKQANEFLALCIRIEPEASELEMIPWETLFDGEDFLVAGVNTTVTRLPLDIPPQASLPAVSLPIKMLALVSSPLDLVDNARLQAEREQEILLEAINDPVGQGRLRVDFEDEAKLEIIESSLETPYQIFHFTGHGLAPEDGGGLLLEEVRGASKAATVAEVVRSLRRGERQLRLAVLSGCQTARTLNVGGFRDMARGLLHCGIPSVIAMQFSISDSGGLLFAERFYSRIAAGYSLELASHTARRALILSGNPYSQADALGAVLLTANGDCLQTFQAQAAQETDVPQIDFSFFLPLPQLSHGFYGRRREYRQIRDGILHHNRRAVIVHGIGGIGKTALISHVATRMKKHFQGTYAFDCSGGTLTPEMVVIKLHRYFEQQGIRALEPLLYQSLPSDVLANHLAQVLSQWSLLLIFDNFESLLERIDAEFQIVDENLRTFIATLVKATATRTHFLFTTRYLFELDEKRLGTIEILALQDLSRPEALNLMQKLPRLATASYSEKLSALETFGGHPYALVTLDRYCHHQSLKQALNDAKNIHDTLREFLAIELNYAQITDRSRKLLNGLAVFRQAFSYEAAEWVLGDKIPLTKEVIQELRTRVEKRGTVDEVTFAELLTFLPERRAAEDLKDRVTELIEWGLLSSIQNGEAQDLSVHALVRNFCRDKQGDDIWHAHLCDAAAFYTNSTKLIKANERSQEVVWIEMEAFELLMEASEFKQAARLLFGATTLLDRWGFPQYLESGYRRLLEKLDGEDAAAVLHNLGPLLQMRGEYDAALQYYERSLKIAEQLNNRVGLARTLHQIGILHSDRGKYDEALEHYHRSLKIFEEVGDRTGIAASLHHIGIVSYECDDFEKALEYYERSLQIEQEVGDSSAMAKTLHQIGILYVQRDEYDKAFEYYERSLIIDEKLGDRTGVASSLHEIAKIQRHRGEYEKALALCQRSLTIAEDLGDRLGIGISLGLLGQILRALGLYQESLRNTLGALYVFLELDNPHIRYVFGDLKILRTQWGAENFDVAWKEATGEDVPDLLTDSEAET